MQQFFEYSHEVNQALQLKKPVLALESTIITHGFPYPHNLEMAKAVEQIVRDHDVVPATTAIMDGKIKIGLNETELNQLVHDKTVTKASRRDIPFLLQQKLNAGTTVAAALFCAYHAGIKIFATGGIGGVHRGNEQDISADLIELARTPMAVVCAGAKAILDLPKTLEFLETFSIPIIGYRTDTLPAFYTAKTNYPLPARVDDIKTLAAILNTHWQLGLSSSMLITNPVPAQDEIPTHVIEPIISHALQKANEQQINGKTVTPFLLTEVLHATSGRSLQANLSLIKNNVRVGAELARAVCTQG